VNQAIIPSSLRRGGCASKKILRSYRTGADGVVAHKPRCVVSDHPVRSKYVASHHFS
jgi:hypothetical protein